MKRRLAFAFGMWMVVYPLVTGLLAMLERTGWGLALPVQAFPVSATLVLAIVFNAVPVVSRLTRVT